jgi:AcrR family transcriptional regulator
LQQNAVNETGAAVFDSFVAILSEERYAHFRAVGPDKQQRILRAALEEFATHDYATTSTNAIVEQARISKGLLFYYFGDKAGLYRCLFSHVIVLLVKEALAWQLVSEGDVFEIMKQMVRAKLETTARYMTEADFMLRAMRDTLPPELDDLVKRSISQAFSWQSVIINTLDGELLRPGIDHDQATQVIQWVCEGLANEYLAVAPSKVDLAYWEKATKRVDSYLDLLRDLFYQKPQTSKAAGTLQKRGERHERT